MSNGRRRRPTAPRATWPQDMVYRRISAPGDDPPLPLPLPLLEIMADWQQAQRFSAALLAAPVRSPAGETPPKLAVEWRAQLAEIRRSRAAGRRSNRRKR